MEEKAGKTEGSREDRDDRRKQEEAGGGRERLEGGRGDERHS